MAQKKVKFIGLTDSLQLTNSLIEKKMMQIFDNDDQMWEIIKQTAWPIPCETQDLRPSTLRLYTKLNGVKIEDFLNWVLKQVDNLQSKQNKNRLAQIVLYGREWYTAAQKDDSFLYDIVQSGLNADIANLLQHP
jgi:hypothetical protein